ncbi:hypothetical protein T03_6171 [Trichinella britovi]|uniref:Uncharacterized protein n=1 Tax=Trichinella britovi TaxID=45882 RepID=A0A0V0YSP8_TRIBR|nr:hypothetical protein T03_6171 [Trichinella britovi]
MAAHLKRRWCWRCASCREVYRRAPGRAEHHVR